MAPCGAGIRRAEYSCYLKSVGTTPEPLATKKNVKHPHKKNLNKKKYIKLKILDIFPKS